MDGVEEIHKKRHPILGMPLSLCVQLLKWYIVSLEGVYEMKKTIELLRRQSILSIPEETQYWLVRADGGKYYEDFFTNGFIAVADNEFDLDSIEKFEQFKEIGYTSEGFKNMINERYPEWNQRKVSHSASRLMNFIHNIKINDIVIVPSHRSNMFLIGLVASDIYEIADNTDIFQEGIISCPYLKRRNVRWLKEVPRQAISEKMYWILTSQHTILSLNEHDQQIDKMIAPIYVKGGNLHCSLKVNKTSGVTSEEWLSLYRVIEDVKSDKEKIVVKANVESPGILELVSSFVDPETARTITIFFLLSGLTIGKINLFGWKHEGFVSYFFGNGKLERDKKKEENESRKLDNERKKIENEKARIEMEVLKQETEIQAQQINSVLKISAFDPGRTIEHRTKMDSLDNQDEEKSE